MPIPCQPTQDRRTRTGELTLSLLGELIGVVRYSIDGPRIELTFSLSGANPNSAISIGSAQAILLTTEAIQLVAQTTTPDRDDVTQQIELTNAVKSNVVGTLRRNKEGWWFD